MKELIIKSTNKVITAQILSGECCGLVIKDDNKEKDFYSDNPKFLFEIYKVLRKAYELGGFNEVDDNVDGGDELKEIIYV